MNIRRNMKTMLIVFCALFLILGIYLVYVINAYGMRWLTNPYNTRLHGQKSNVVAGDILDRDGVKLATTNQDGERIYADDRSMRQATAHVVGDNYGQTFGAETFFSKYLLGFDQSILERISQAMSGSKRYGSDVKLTVDGPLSDYIYKQMDDYKGAVVVMNYKTGEVLAAVSRPGYDPKYMKDYLNEEIDLDQSAMVNRVTMGRYTPGSVFKIVTTVAAIRYLPGVTERTFTCDGPLVFDSKTGEYLPHVHISPEEDKGDAQGIITLEGNEDQALTEEKSYALVRDYNREYHGEITLKTAFAKSCNHVFAQLAMEVGSSRLQKVANDLGVGDDFLFDDMVAYSSSYEKPKTDQDLAWSGVGQYKDLMTPLHMCMITAGIANDGVIMQPELLESIITPRGQETTKRFRKVYKSAFAENEVQVLREYMIETVKNGTGRNAKVSGYTVGGKTGTAEVGAGERPNAWYTGFVLSEEHPLAICVVLEEGGSGGSKAAPIAGKVLDKAIDLGL